MAMLVLRVVLASLMAVSGARVRVHDVLAGQNVALPSDWAVGTKYVCLQKQTKEGDQFCLVKYVKDLPQQQLRNAQLRYALDINACADKQVMKVCKLSGEGNDLTMSYSSKKVVGKSCFRRSGTAVIEAKVPESLCAGIKWGEIGTGLGKTQATAPLQVELQYVHALEEQNLNLRAKLMTLHKMQADECAVTCKDRQSYGRWHNAAYGHQCFTHSGESVCICSSSEDLPDECDKDALPGSFVETSSSQNVTAHVEVDGGLQQSSALTELDVASIGGEIQTVQVDGLRDAEDSPLPGSVRQIVGDFCDSEGLKEMQGKKSLDSDQDALKEVQGESNEDSPSNRLESAILADVANELESNNVDKMAKDIFTFYMCVRWVPDKTFFELARQELAASIVEAMVDHSEKPDQAIAELYQKFKYVPLLCSRNLNVFGEKHQGDHTFFRNFKEKVDEMSGWLKKASGSLVSTRLKQTDEIFCGEGTKMNSEGCKFNLKLNEHLNHVTKLFGTRLDTQTDQWAKLNNIFRQFEGDGGAAGGTAEWQRNVQEWKARFPYHSFISKNDPVGASKAPYGNQRIVVCFGKRVASEMHRRPSGQHLLTDQNNIGCHGWWDEERGADMLQRLTTLWRPPTCQLADMTYTMKREILSMFARMNMRLFDALPSMLTDEFLKEKGMLEPHIKGPGGYAPSQITINDDQFVDEMRVSLLSAEFREPPNCNSELLDVVKNSSHSSTCLILKRGALGSVMVLQESKLKVVWDLDKDKKPLEMNPTDLRIMPHRWASPKGAMGHMKDLVAGVGKLKDKAAGIFGSMFSQNYDSIGHMMSGSVSKWVVCPVKAAVDMKKLDAHLGVEDAAFQDFQKDAYAKFTKYKAKVPGEECEKPSFLLDAKFSKAAICEISVLHADHVEKFTYLDDTPLGGLKKGQLEPFICPMKPSLPADEQLEVLGQKNDKCYLHMSEEQLRHYTWLYQGKHPARRQHDRKANVPLTEYELLKVLKVSSGVDSETSFGRYCTVDELATTPRFCDPPELYNPWMNLEEMAQSLEEVAAGALGIGSSAISNAISLYQSGLKNRSAQETALMLSEKTWDGLTGSGRLLKSAADVGLSEISNRLPGESRRSAELQLKHFRTIESGLGLHSLSFQRSIGSNSTTSNAKERFQRYVLTIPCQGYDPVIRYQIDKKWGDGALRMLREAHIRFSEPLLARTHVELLLRGQATLFETVNVHSENAHHYVFDAAMSWPKEEGSLDQKLKVNCSGNKLTGCKPKHHCVSKGLICVPVTALESDWWPVQDSKLAAYVGGNPVSTGNMDLDKLYGIHVNVYCGAKTAFKRTGGSDPKDASFKDCLLRGVKENARSRALYPWKVYFPEEVVVVATFEQIVGQRCNPVDGISEEMMKLLCSEDVIRAHGEDEHVKKEIRLSSEYRGLHTGSGFARGTPNEVMMRPEDVLEALGLL